MTVSIIRCTGYGCPFRVGCYRYEPKADKIKNLKGNQQYFDKPPFTNNRGVYDCEMYWGDRAQRMLLALIQLESGTN